MAAGIVAGREDRGQVAAGEEQVAVINNLVRPNDQLDAVHPAHQETKMSLDER